MGWVYPSIGKKMQNLEKMGWVYPSIRKKNAKFGKNLHGGYQNGSCKKFQHTLRNFFPDPPPGWAIKNAPKIQSGITHV